MVSADSVFVDGVLVTCVPVASEEKRTESEKKMVT
jgi:hypothetical protein